MLSTRYPEDVMKSILLSRESWHPFPVADEREPWQALPTPVQRVHLQRGEDAFGLEWPPLPAVRFLDYRRNGDRSRYQALSFGRRNALRDLVIAECLEGRGRFLDQIMNGIWAICEESFWGVPAHIGVQKAGSGLPDVTEPIVDLFAAETSALLAWTAYLLAPQLDGVSPLIVPRITLEINRRILTPLLERDDFGWMGFRGQRVNNWNPWIASNWLTSALLIEQDADRRLRLVAKAMRALDNFIDPYPADGGCDEGPSYWGRAGGALYDCLELLRSATDGQIDVYSEPLIQNIGKFVYRVQIHDRYFVNFADAPAMLTPSPGVVYGYGKRIQDPQMAALGMWAAAQQDIEHRGSSDSLGRALPLLFDWPELLEPEPVSPPLPRDVWLDAIEVMVARDKAGSSEGFFVAAKGGHNAESHNHNDVGHFVLYLDGRPVIVDAGVEAYTAKTFSSRRYEIWTMQSAYHSLPTVNSVQQAPGHQFAARGVQYRADDQSAELTLNIAGAYPESAGINSWKRIIKLTRGESVTLIDAYDLKCIEGLLSLHMLTVCDVILEQEGKLMLCARPLADEHVSGAAQLHYPSDRLRVSTETIAVEDGRLRSIWGETLTRITFQAESSVRKGTWTLRYTRLED